MSSSQVLIDSNHIDELTRHAALQTKSTFLRQIAKADLLILDDFGLTPLPDQIRRDEIRCLNESIYVLSQPARHPLETLADMRGISNPCRRERRRVLFVVFSEHAKSSRFGQSPTATFLSQYSDRADI